MRQMSVIRWIWILIVLMTVSVGCEFRTTEYTLTVNTNGSGYVSPAGGTYDEGTVVTLTATAASGWEFSGWSGSVRGSSATIRVTMNSNKTVTATFVENDDDTKFVGNITQRGIIPDNFGDYWDQITSENGGKWASVEGTRDVMNWSGIDRAYNYAKQNGIPYKQHTFVWGSQYPSWMDNLSAAEQKAEVEEWIRLYCERYPDTAMIDVVNEPDHATPGWASAIGGAGNTGHDWVIWSFEKAREYCPDSTLILNDYNVLRWNTDNFISIALKVKNRGLLDAVGAQAHGLETQSFSELQSNFNKVKGIGVPIYISEYDINLSDDAEQLQVMSEQFPLFYEDDQVAGITFWGYIYGETWKSDTGLIRYGTPRPAMDWLMDYLSDF